MTPLQQTLVRIALEVNAQATIKEAADLDRKFGDIGIDSLEAMSLMLMVTEHFDIKIPDAEIDTVMTMNELARLVERELTSLGRQA
ncbi:MAG: acyl carrier protein [Rhodocyclales bacterium]|nr:acyl carrier protein [Rhodocyclales bacterium]